MNGGGVAVDVAVDVDIDGNDDEEEVVIAVAVVERYVLPLGTTGIRKIFVGSLVAIPFCKLCSVQCLECDGKD